MDTQGYGGSLKKVIKWSGWKWVLGLLTIAILMYVNFWYVSGEYGNPSSPSAFGDSFGGVGALFSGIALIGVFITLREQQKQIAEQKNFLARSEMNDTFFKLLDHLKEIKLELGWSNSEGEKLKLLYEELKSGYSNSSEEQLVAIFREFYAKHSIDLDNYFRTLRYLLRYLAVQPLDFEKKRVYSNLLRAKISQEEAAMIYYNMEDRTLMKDHGFQEYIQRFNLLADLKAWPEIYTPHADRIDRFVMACKSDPKTK